MCISTDFGSYSDFKVDELAKLDGKLCTTQSKQKEKQI